MSAARKLDRTIRRAIHVPCDEDESPYCLSSPEYIGWKSAQKGFEQIPLMRTYKYGSHEWLRCLKARERELGIHQDSYPVERAQ